ncbi:conserved hypothetical protein [Catenulispora acidiphila DSM 44928]|uniref:PIN domain-containing protein n=1 Tax=Catenulispora acidiphila (strain DSM 44928 / JCM 14897 / NBRC 102108 / NRRL B-24433 / ID139908) TaxID=479433 RepID=C7Q3J2_CATAD|nr:PIN domain-containing protein [Catenulispora acidiphila]ACU75757.1 conserved hypothetical protein [Catenulispora acidiphila DSM 44928]
MSKATTAPPSYIERLCAELGAIHADYREVLSASKIINVDPNRGRSSGLVVFMNPVVWAWAGSDPDLDRERMALLRKVRDWEPRFRLLFPHPTPEVAERLDVHIGRLTRWLIRPKRDKIPGSLTAAAQAIDASVEELLALVKVLPPDAFAVRLTVDTNTLIDNPDVAVHTATLGPRYMVHLLPVVLREIDGLKRAGRTELLRDGAARADRRLKHLRSNGDVLLGVKVAGDVHALFEVVEPRGDQLPSWLDLDVPDDRFVASSLLVQSDHPGSTLFVATSDINLQTKLSQVGLPYVELP